MKEVKAIEVRKGMTANELVKEFEKAGVMQSGKIARAINIYEEMIRDKKCTKFFGIAGAFVPAGMQKILAEFLENKWIDVLVCTGATLTHDLVEGIGFKHLQGTEKADDFELQKKGYDRIYDSYMKNTAYPKLEEFLKETLKEVNGKISARMLLEKIGEKSPEGTLLNTAFRKKVPIYCPALENSGLGIQIAFLEKSFEVEYFADLKEVMDLAWNAEKKGVIYIAGGEPKNYIQQAMQFRKPADYGIQITMEPQESGGSSGAELKEGISWGKMKEKGKYESVFGDANVYLPIISAALKERLL